MDTQLIVDEVSLYFLNKVRKASSFGWASVAPRLKLDIVNNLPVNTDKVYELESIDQACDILMGISSKPKYQCKKLIREFVLTHQLDTSKKLYLIAFLSQVYAA